MNTNKRLLIAGVIAAMAVLAVPAFALAAVWKDKGTSITTFTEISLTGAEIFETSAENGMNCGLKATLVTEGGATGEITTFDVTECPSGFGSFKGCTVTSTSAKGLPWAVHVNATDLTVTGWRVKRTFGAGCPIESLDPADLLRTVFATKLGDSLSMPPTRLTAGLNAFAGQTVRIRIAVTVTEEVLNAGVDAVSIASSAGQTGSARGGRKPVLFSFGRLTVKRSKGIATLRVRVSGAGLLRASESRRRGGVAAASQLSAPRRLIEPTTVPIAEARTVTVHLRPTAAARTVLKRRKRLRVPVAVTFMPVGASAETAVLPVVFRLANLSK
jgi:hypothetical protein